MALLGGRLVVVFLSILWAFITVWQEYLQFRLDGSRCGWPDHKFESVESSSERRPQHVLIVADPQILDHRSYPGRGVFLTYLSRLIVDLNLRKNWWVAISKKPDAVVFLGDMMDGGRFDMSDEEYEEYYRRFRSIFRLDPAIPQYFIPGNHDTGLGFSVAFSPYSHVRYMTHFGDKNYVVQLANHTLAFIDAPGFVDEEYKRLGLAKTYENWKPLSGGTLQFMKKFKKEEYRDPVILFTHVPLYRPDGRGCGPLRERGTIRPGVGNGYQNTFAKQSTQKILELLQPSLIFSGDDHDYCEHIHSLSTSRFQQGPHTAREVTVKSLSMAMGVRRPGFQLLSLAPFDLRIPADDTLTPNVQSYADTPCLLPDQLGSYLNVYIPLLVVSLITVILSNLVTLGQPRSGFKTSVGSDSDIQERTRGSRPTFRLIPGNLGPRRECGDSYSSGNDSLPPPVSGGFSDKSKSVFRGYFVRFFTPRSRRRRRSLSGRLFGCLYDIWDIATYPIGIFIVFTCWFTYW